MFIHVCMFIHIDLSAFLWGQRWAPTVIFSAGWYMVNSLNNQERILPTNLKTLELKNDILEMIVRFNKI